MVTLKQSACAPLASAGIDTATGPDRMTSRRRLLMAGAAALAALAVGPLLDAAPAAAQVAVSEGDLMGTWRGIERAGALQVNGEIIFYGNGTYRRMHWIGALQTWDTGTIQIAQNWVHFNVGDYQPKIYNRVYQAPPPSETWMVNGFNGMVIEGAIGGAAFFHYEKIN